MSQADKKPYNCNICDRRFATEASLNHHVTKVGKATTNVTLQQAPGKATTNVTLKQAQGKATTSVTLKQAPGRRDSQSLLERVC